MFSSSPSPSLRALIALAPFVGALACGHKEPPKPPPSKIPAATSDLAVQQRGQEILLTLSYPATTMGGLAIENLEALEIWELTRIVPTFLLEVGAEEIESGDAATIDEDGEPAARDEGTTDEPLVAPTAGEPPSYEEPRDGASAAEAEESVEEEPGGTEESLQSLMFRFPLEESEPTEPEKSKEDLVPVDPSEFAGQARLLRTVVGAELDAAVAGPRLILRLPLSEASPAETEAHIYAVKSRAGRHRTSAFSNLVKIVPRTPPAPPIDLEVTASGRGVELTWRSEEPVVGFRIYRRDARSRDYGAPLFTASPAAASYLDTGARYENRYIYTVTAQSSKQPVVESAVAAEYEIDFQDRFPPPAPGGLVALAEEGRVRLIWDPVTATDLAGYRLLRREPGGELQPVHAEAVVGQEYLDRDVISGRTYGYAIVAVDQKGNSSESSKVIEVRVP